MRLDLFAKLMCQSNTKILSAAINYSVRELFFDVNIYARPQSNDMRHLR